MTLEYILRPPSVTGLLVAALFLICSLVFLSFQRRKNYLVLIKIQTTFCFFLNNLCLLLGFINLNKNDACCKTITLLLNHFVISTFSWICIDIYYLQQCAVEARNHGSVLYMSLFIWAVPIPFLGVGVFLSLSYDERVGFLHDLFLCWNSDYMLWPTFVSVCIICLVALFLLLSAFLRLHPTSKIDGKKLDNIKYCLKTNAVLLLFNMCTLAFLCVTFWYDDINWHRLFGLSTGIQGLFFFFFNVVFCLEFDIFLKPEKPRERFTNSTSAMVSGNPAPTTEPPGITIGFHNASFQTSSQISITTERKHSRKEDSGISVENASDAKSAGKRVSFTTPVSSMSGMNELEMLFSRPDVMLKHMRNEHTISTNN